MLNQSTRSIGSRSSHFGTTVLWTKVSFSLPTAVGIWPVFGTSPRAGLVRKYPVEAGIRIEPPTSDPISKDGTEQAPIRLPSLKIHQLSDLYGIVSQPVTVLLDSIHMQARTRCSRAHQDTACIFHSHDDGHIYKCFHMLSGIDLRYEQFSAWKQSLLEREPCGKVWIAPAEQVPLMKLSFSRRSTSVATLVHRILIGVNHCISW